MAAFTTTSSASTYVINTLILIAVIAIGGVIGSYVMLNRSSADQAVATISAPVATAASTATEIRHID